ncbi:MAG: hypothetical protein J6X18_00535 [Bacteroidales bacterium]|nr:hypothetical protein [Bacteroidales bacterium]
MDYEERYKQALERAKELHDKHPYGEPPIWKTCEDIFPELKESEDEKIRKSIIELVKQSSHILNSMNQKSMISWLEKQKPIEDNEEYLRKDDLLRWVDIQWQASLSDGHMRGAYNSLYQLLKSVTPDEFKPAEWNMEDENTRNKIIGSLDALKFYVERNNEFDKERVESNLKELDEEIKWMQDIVPQPTQEWSEEDEKKRDGLVKGLEDRMGFGWANQPFTREEYIEWLKSLKPQPNMYDKGYKDGYSAANYNRWKPTEEQMEHLNRCFTGRILPDADVLESLYNDLKSL